MNQIHPTCLIEPTVRLGRNNVILPYTILQGPLEIGDNNVIGPHVVIGSPGQDTKNPRYDHSEKKITIGSDNMIREFTVIQKPCHTDLTEVGSRVYLMHNVHVPHDARIEDDAVLTPMVALAGHSKILRGANLGLGVTVHQHTVIGAFTMIAMGATVLKNVRPFSKFIPGQPLSVNSYALQKFHLEEFTDEVTAYVLEGRRPKADPILALVESYERCHSASKRKEVL